MKKFQKSFVVLVIVFLAVIFGGRYLFGGSTTVENLPPAGKASVATSTNVSETNSNTSVAKSEPTPAPLDTCAETIKADLTKNKQSYAKGQILVTFNPAVTYIEAKDALSVYGLVVQNEVDSQSSFNTRHLITAAVAPGQEISRVCQLRSDTHVKYAALDVYFGLHE
jgi:hypothetical protein